MMDIRSADLNSHKRRKKRGSVMKKAPAPRSPGRPKGAKDAKKRKIVKKKVVKTKKKA